MAQVKYCKTTVTDQLKADSKFAKPWDQVINLGTWITMLEQQRCKFKEVGVAIDNGHMVLKSRIMQRSIHCSPLQTTRRTTIYKATIWTR